MTDEAAKGQKQVEEAFSHKWRKSPGFGVSDESSRDVMTPWMMEVLGHADEKAYARYLARFRNILDAGCGNGRESIRMARLNPNAMVTGIDISDAVDIAAANGKGIPNLRFVRGDLMQSGLQPRSFDHILSFGVLHHTPSTRDAFSAVADLLAPGGEFAFYVYRKKAPLREFADDHIREVLQGMSPDDAWVEMGKLTVLGRELSRLGAEIDVPEIRTLGIEAGRHNVQRLIYYTMLKCYWRDAFTFEENVHVNFDWYAPKFAWRHTAMEIREWFGPTGTRETYMQEIPAGYTFRVARA